MALNGSRLQVNTNGATPLADSTSGAAGTVTGGERGLLAKLLAAAVDTLSGFLVARGFSIVPSSDSPTAIALRHTNAANTVNNWLIQQNGAASGITLAQVGTVQDYNIPSAAYSANQTVVNVGLGAGTWLIFSHWQANSANGGYNFYRNGGFQEGSNGPVAVSNITGYYTSTSLPIVFVGGATLAVNIAFTETLNGYIRCVRVG